MKLSELERLAREATQGPWDWTHDGGSAVGRVGKVLPTEPVEHCGYDSHCIALTHGSGRFDQRANAAFIAAANPQTILRMIEVIKAADLLVKNREHIASVEGTPLWLDVKNLRSALKEMEK